LLGTHEDGHQIQPPETLFCLKKESRGQRAAGVSCYRALCAIGKVTTILASFLERTNAIFDTHFGQKRFFGLMCRSRIRYRSGNLMAGSSLVGPSKLVANRLGSFEAAPTYAPMIWWSCQELRSKKAGYQGEECALMHSRVSTLLGVGLIGLALTMSSARAGTILVFGQSGIANEFTATNNGSLGDVGGTTLSAVDIPVTITSIANAGPMPGSFPTAFFNLIASSVSNATVDSSGNIVQEFSGSFWITSLAGGTGTNYLSGTFDDAVFGSGSGLGMTGSGPLGVPAFTSEVIASLSQLRGISFSFGNVTPTASITGNMTLGAFTSSVSGAFSASPEPASLVLLAIGMTGLVAYGCRFRRTAGL
jgi:hypothetical protein